MNKNIVFCADGTWNGPGEDPNNTSLSGTTNVFKLFCNLAGAPTPDSTRLKDEQESVLTAGNGTTIQVAKYINGVGDSDNFLVKLLGGTLGAGIISRIVRGYTFISRSFVPGDRIFIVGFSRGAYTARALAGLICAKGLLDASKIDLKGDPAVSGSVDTARQKAYRLGSAVWYDYRKSQLKDDGSLLGALEELAIDLPGFLTKAPTDKLINAPIAAVAVWDTVGALGIPEYSLVSDKRIQAMRFADNNLNANVGLGFHAMSIDEQRADFTPTLWNGRQGIEQRLFAGAHADVGGGYPGGVESGLSDVALVWMSQQLAAAGVNLATPVVYGSMPLATGTAHEPWLTPPWNVLPRAARQFPPEIRQNADPSVDARRHGGPVRADPSLAPSLYDPKNI
jgi:hypothetical protein